MTHHPGWPRVTWYGMPSHLVPVSQSWRFTIGTCFLEENIRKNKKSAAQTKKPTNREPSSSKTSHTNSLWSWPREKNTTEHFHQHNARLEAAKVELTAPLTPLNPSHQLLWLVAGNVLRRRKQHEYVSRVYACNRTSSVNVVWDLSWAIAHVLNADTC